MTTLIKAEIIKKRRSFGYAVSWLTKKQGNEMTKRQSWKRDFYILWSGQAISILTSSVLQMALIWHLTERTQSAMVLSMASLAGFLPSAVLGMVAGTLVDRISRKTAMIGADLFIAGVSLVLVFTARNGELPMWLILSVLAVRSLGTAFHTPAISATTPLLAPAEELTKCAGYTHSLETAGFIVGTGVAGVLYPMCSISEMVALDVAGAFIATIAVAVIKIPALKEQADKQPVSGIWKEMKAGYNILKKEKGLFALLWIAAVFLILYAPINALFPLMSLEHFKKTTLHASIAEIAFAAGMLAGGLLLGVWGGFSNRGKGIALSVAIMGLPVCLSGLLPSNGFWGFALLCVFMGCSVPFYNGPVTALMQERIAPEYLGRVFGMYGSIASLAMPIGLVLSGIFADRLGLSAWFFMTGSLCTVLAVITYLIPSIRKIDG